MDVLVGPTLSFDVPPPPPPARDRPTGTVFFAGESSDSSSSIGTPDDSDHENDLVSPKRNREEEEEDEEVQSKLNGLSSLDSLEDSLPIKRGLSSHFIGKSKSFTDLSEVTTVKELQKQENPFNKRRRVLIAAKLSRRSFYTWSNPKSMPLLPVDEDEDDDENEAYNNNNNNNKEATKVSPSSSSSSSSSAEEKRKPQEQVLLRQHNIVPHSYAAHTRLRLGSFKSRSFSLADLQEHEEEEGGEEDTDVPHLG